MDLDLTYLLEGDEFIQEHVKTLADGQQSRFNDALGPQYKVYPTSTQSYQVFSETEDMDEVKSYFIITAGHDLSCSCHDFYYNSDIDGEVKKCKHLWRLWVEIYAGYVQPSDENPREWLMNQVEQELYMLLDSYDNGEPPEEDLKKMRQLRAIRRYLKSTQAVEIDYVKLFRSWASYKTSMKSDKTEQSHT